MNSQEIINEIFRLPLAEQQQVLATVSANLKRLDDQENTLDKPHLFDALNDLVGAIDSSAQPTQNVSSTRFGSALEIKFAKQGIKKT